MSIATLSNGEFDFVVRDDDAINIVTVEVKSGVTRTLKSLHQFMGIKNAPLAVRFDSNKPSDQQINTKIAVNNEPKSVQYKLRSLPLYLVERIDSLISV